MAGVTQQGYERKELAEALADIQARMVAIFGAGVIQTPQSPLGQLNGLFTDLVAEAEDRNALIYASLDPTQASGAQLDKIGALRGLLRASGQSDASYARTITNEGQARFTMSDVLQSVRAVDGVTWASVKENPTQFTDGSGIPPHSLAFAAIGGNDADVARAIYDNSAPGIGLFGPSGMAITVDGYARETRFIRPVDVPIYVDLTVRLVPGCDPGAISPAEVVAFLDQEANGPCGLLNGDLIDEDKIDALLNGLPGVVLESGLSGIAPDNVSADGYQADINERPVLVAKNMIVRFA